MLDIAPRRRRIPLDARFLVEVLTLGALAVALAGPRLTSRSPIGRRVVLILDNAPAARARQPSGRPVWEDLAKAASEVQWSLSSADRLAIACTSPLLRRLDGGAGLEPSEAAKLLRSLEPALSGPSVEEVYFFACQEARLFGGPDQPAPVLVVSARAAPSALPPSPRVRWRTAGPGPVLGNVGFTAFGSSAEAGGAELLVQVRNFSAHSATGQVQLESDGRPLATKDVALAPEGSAGVAFHVAAGPRAPLVLIWHAQAGPDALPEDDRLVVAPRQLRRPKVRWHGAAPHLEDLFRLALDAESVPLESSVEADLEIYVDAVPESVPAGARSALLLAPPRDFSPCEVLPGVVEWPAAWRGQDDPLTRNLLDGPDGLGFPIAKARRLRQVGDWRVLIQDGLGGCLVARFRLAEGRPAYVCAFVPGEGLGWARERKFDHPGLAALLLRLLREASGSSEPYTVETAAELEKAVGKPLPLSWSPAYDAARNTGQGVLDLRVSRLELGEPRREQFDLHDLAPMQRESVVALWPLLVGAAVALILVEVWLERR